MIIKETKVKRIAMWSGPRNISTAMMRSWENREDTIVVDEPLYGHYLHKTKKHHPMFTEIIQDQGKNQAAIIDQLVNGELPKNKAIYYQKHMCHHILDDLEISWIKKLFNVFLIRDPRYVLSSYLKKHSDVSPQDLGFPQQLKLFNYIKEECGYTPIVLDSKDVLQNPKGMIKLLCKNLGIQFDNKMLKWPKGYRKSDGIWAKHWYNQVIKSTGFAQYFSKQVSLNRQEQRVANQCLPIYEKLSKYVIKS